MSERFRGYEEEYQSIDRAKGLIQELNREVNYWREACQQKGSQARNWEFLALVSVPFAAAGWVMAGVLYFR